MVAICRAWRLSARGNPPHRPKLEVWLWTMVFRPEEADGSKTRHSGSSVRSPVERDVPQHRADPSASEVGLQSNQRPLCDIPKGSGAKTGAPSISVSVSMTNLLLRFLPRTVSLGSVSVHASSHAAGAGPNRSAMARTVASTYPSCPMNARPRRLDAPGTLPSWEELLGER